MQELPFVSIVMPVVNTSQEFEEALLSLKCQDYKNIEFVIIVDTPNSAPIKKTLKKIANKDKRFKLYTNKRNCGTYVARKIGVENSLGELICFLDSDDFFCESNTISQMIDCYLVNCPDVLCASFYEFYPEKKITKQLKNQIFCKLNSQEEQLANTCENITIFKDNFLEEMLLKKAMPTFLWGKIYKKNLLVCVYDLLPVGNIFMLEDFLVNFFVCFFAKTFVTTDICLFCYRRKSGITATNVLNYDKFEKIVSFESVFTIIFEFIEENKKEYPVSDRIQAELSNIAFIQIVKLLKGVLLMKNEEEKATALKYLKQSFGEKLIAKALNTTKNGIDI